MALPSFLNSAHSFSINKRPKHTYRGRFAPSPSGLLHFGSLVTALASYLDARSQQGVWLVRIEDIDPPREQQGASYAILNTLEHFGLTWDESVLFQSTQSKGYEEVLAYLLDQKLSYYCHCTRADIQSKGGIYNGTCRDLHLCKHQATSTDNQLAIRIINAQPVEHFIDLIHGKFQSEKAFAREDFTLRRKDGLFAYQLAVVIDDIYQGITHIVRGCDLLETTVKQLSLFNVLGAKTPKYAHIPLAITDSGFKLSKQNKAPILDSEKVCETLVLALKFLGQNPPKDLSLSHKDDILRWAINNWSLNSIPKEQKIMVSAN